VRFDVDGHALDYEVRGGGRAIVLVHGLTTDRRILVEACEPVLAAAGLRRIYLDLPGHGASQGAPARASADDLVAALAVFVREVGGERPLLLGYSYGGYLAQGLLREVDAGGLCLVCPVVEADFGKRTTPPRRVIARDEALPFSDDEREQAAFLEVAVQATRPVLERFQRVVHPANIAVDPEFVAAVRHRYAMARPYMQALQAFDRPVAIACGRHDHWVGFEDAVRLARALPRAGLSVVADCGQLLPLEAPAAFHALLADWLARAGSAPSGDTG
jgi:pimeloyl-ACP methyl ester carboxylesterase